MNLKLFDYFISFYSIFSFPFEVNHQVYCTHSSGSGSHSWPNAYYALDLATSYNEPAAKILAAADGRAFVFFSEDGSLCPRPRGTASSAESSSCGVSWGNRVKILHEGGYYSFYTHLDQVLIKNDTLVKRGEPIGIEGWTGAAGHRHLHFSVQKLPGTNEKEWIDKMSWDGESVPFQFQALVNGKLTTIDTSKFHCAHANIGVASTSSEQPILSSP